MTATTPITPPITPATQTPGAPSRTASRPASKPINRSSTRPTSTTTPSSWTASARTMPRGVSPAVFAQALAQASMARQPIQSTARQTATGQSTVSQPSPIQALALQSMMTGAGRDGIPSLFSTGPNDETPTQAQLFQVLAQRSAPAQAAAAAPTQAAPPAPAATGVLDLPNGLGPIVQKAADKYGVDPALIAGVIETESNFNPGAVSRAGARGLMQLMPATARGLGVTDANDPLQNVLGGAKLLGQMLDKYHGNVELALAAYNAGAGNVDKYGGIPPFGETRRYVPTVMAAYERFRQLASTQATAQAAAGRTDAASTPHQTTGQTPGRATGR
jgi:soluble lytic murein transglycosylase-like protein